MLHLLILVLSSFVGSPFLRSAVVVAGAVMLRMLRCVSLSSLRLCGAHVVGGSCTCMPVVGSVFLSVLFSSCCPSCSLLSSALLLFSSLSSSLSLSQWKDRHLDCRDLGRTSSVSGQFLCFYLSFFRAGTLGYML